MEELPTPTIDNLTKPTDLSGVTDPEPTCVKPSETRAIKDNVGTGLCDIRKQYSTNFVQSKSLIPGSKRVLEKRDNETVVVGRASKREWEAAYSASRKKTTGNFPAIASQSDNAEGIEHKIAKFVSDAACNEESLHDSVSPVSQGPPAGAALTTPMPHPTAPVPVIPSAPPPVPPPPGLATSPLLASATLDSPNTPPVIQHAPITLNKVHSVKPCSKIFYMETEMYTRHRTDEDMPRGLLASFATGSTNLTRVRWCPDVYNHLLATSSRSQGQLHVYDALGKLNRVAILRPHSDGVSVSNLNDFQWISSGSHILSVGADKSARITDVETQYELERFRWSADLLCVAVHPALPNIFLTGSADAAVVCWDRRAASTPVRSYRGRFGPVLDVMFNPTVGGREFFATTEVFGDSSPMLAWSLQEPSVLSNKFYPGRRVCPRLAVPPVGKYFVAQCRGDYILTFHTARPFFHIEQKLFRSGHLVGDSDVGLSFSRNGRVLVSASTDGQLWFYDFSSKKARLLKTLVGASTSPVLDVSYHPDLPNIVGSCTEDGSLLLWK